MRPCAADAGLLLLPQELGQHNPHLIHLIRDNEEEFLQILSTGNLFSQGHGRGKPARRP